MSGGAEARLEGLAVMLRQVLERLDRIEEGVTVIGELVRLNLQTLEEFDVSEGNRGADHGRPAD